MGTEKINTWNKNKYNDADDFQHRKRDTQCDVKCKLRLFINIFEFGKVAVKHPKTDDDKQRR